MIMPRFPNRIPTERFTPQTLTYQANVIANSGIVTTETLRVVDKFSRDMRDAGLLVKLQECGVFAGGNLAAAMVKFVYGPQNFCTNVNYVGGDFTERGSTAGLNGDGATKYLNTAFPASSLSSTGHLSVYLRDDALVVGNHGLIGNINGTDQFFIGGLNAISTADARYGQLNAVTNNTGLIKGFYQLARPSSTNLRMYLNGVMVNSSSTSTTFTAPTGNLLIGCYGVSGVASAYTAGRIAFYSIGDQMSDTEAATFYSIVQTMQSNFGRNV